MLDLDGTIYQAMDLQEEAPHATKANGRSVGIEIANVGRVPRQHCALNEWYKKDASGQIAIKIPAEFGDGGIRTKDFVGRPARQEIIKGIVQGKSAQAIRSHSATIQFADPPHRCVVYGVPENHLRLSAAET